MAPGRQAVLRNQFAGFGVEVGMLRTLRGRRRPALVSTSMDENTDAMPARMKHDRRPASCILGWAALLFFSAFCFLGAVQPAWAQDVFLAGWQAKRSKQPGDVRFELSLPGGKSEFWMGEIIPLECQLSALSPKRWAADSRMYDRVGRLNFTEEFHLDPADKVVDPLEGLPGAGGGMGGISGGAAILGDEPFVYERDLNEWIRFLEPGKYRLYVTSRRALRILGSERSESSIQRYEHGQPAELVSNIVTLEIRRPPVGWARRQLDAALEILDLPDPQPNDHEAVRQVGRVLRFLETPEAAEAMARRLGRGFEFPIGDFSLGILASPYRDQTLPLLELLLEAPDQPVSSLVVNTMAQLYGLANAGRPMPPYPSDNPAAQQEWQAESRKRWEQQQRQSENYYSRLASSIGRKQPEARAICLHTLVNESQTDASRPLPAWYPRMAELLAENFLDLPANVQRDLLSSGWSRIASPQMAPVLREIYKNPPEPPVDPALEDLALRRLYELAPGEARRLILEQIRRPTKRLSWQTLGMLEEKTQPELNEVLAGRLEGGGYDDRLIVRYGDRGILERVKGAYEKLRTEAAERDEPLCLTPLHFYLLKFDPEYGEREVRRVFSDQRTAYPACRDMGWLSHELGRYVMSPALEKVAIEYLGDSSVVIKKGAAEILGRFGSAAAEKPLWETMVFFRNWWKGREEELKEPHGEEGMQFERSLRQALAQADGWVLDPRQLERLRALCSSDWCRQDVDQWIREAESPVRVQIDSADRDNFWVHLGQYPLRSFDDVERKLGQFPAGTRFRWEMNLGEGAPPALRKAREQIGGLIEGRGFVLLEAMSAVPQ